MTYKIKKKMIHFSFVFVLIPLVLLPYYLIIDKPREEHKLYEQRDIDKFKVVLIEEEKKLPYTIFGGEKMKDYGLKFDTEALEYIRIANLQVSVNPPEISLLRGVAHGNPYELHVHVPFPKDIKQEDKLWLSIEKWDGTIHQIFWSVHDVISTD